jgi:hypothetical protein
MAGGTELDADERRLAGYAAALADGIDDALPGWVVRSVVRIARAWRSEDAPDLRAQAEAAGVRARDEVAPAVRTLLDADVDEQWTNPLDLVRRAVRYPTEVLRAAGVPPVVRDEHAERLFPDDDYDLVPGSFADLDPALREPGLVWGAAKAHVVLTRRRREGRR